MYRVLALGLAWWIGYGGIGPVAQAATLEELESQIQALQVQVQELKRQQEMARIETGEPVPYEERGVLRNIKNPAGFGNVTVGGYVDAEFENFENTNSTFDQARFVLNVAADLHERLRFYSEYEIEHGGPNAADAGEAKVEQAWIDYRIVDPVNVRAGIVLVPMGLFNLTHDSDIQDFTARPLVARRVIPSTWMEVGAGFNGDLALGEWMAQDGLLQDLHMSYEFYAVNGLDEDISDTGLRNATGAIETDLNNDKAGVARIAVSPFLGHTVGFSGYTGRHGTGEDDDILGGALDWDLNFGPLQLLGEWVAFDVDGFVDDDNSSTTARVAAPDTLQGLLAQVNYHFWPDFLNQTFLGRNFENPMLTASLSYGWVQNEDDGDSNTGDNEEDRYTFGLNYRPVESWALKVEYQLNDQEGTESLERGDNDGVMASVAMGF
ncbi:MAG: hypothetical protein HYY14_04785 [Candidatus Omnitrophica bacterium]|nr:hypothetical protein [Candidatus Omnitrophota bacterium]